MASSEADDVTWLLDLPPSARQTWAAATVAAITLVGFAALVPFAGRPLTELNAFFPSLDAIVFVTDLITSALLFAQFSISRSRSLLVLASGYLFTALIVIPHALTFAGAFSPTGLLGAGLQTGSWLYILWHFGFAVALLAYAALRRARRVELVSETSTLPMIRWSVAGVFVLVCGLTWLATAGAALLPPIILDKTHISPFVIYPITLTILTSAAALAVLLVCRRSVLDQWLMVVALVSILELVFSGLLPSVRFSLGFYAGRSFSLITSSVVLVVLVAETIRLYANLARSNAMLQRERNNRLMNVEAVVASIAHEVKQPLLGVTARGSAARRFLAQSSPDIEKVQRMLDEIVGAGFRANEVFENIRALFRTAALENELIDVNELVLGALRILYSELEAHDITTNMELTCNPPFITGHKGQLQEVILNLIQNAIDAMQAVTNRSRILRIHTEQQGPEVIMIKVEDSGPGIDPEKISRMFTAFVTTKAKGMGLGLAICQMIVERHGGRLSVSSQLGEGARFQLILPIKTVAQVGQTVG